MSVTGTICLESSSGRLQGWAI